MLGCKVVEAPMNSNSKLLPHLGELLEDPSRYIRLVGRLNYFTVTWPDISFAASVISQFLSTFKRSHWDVQYAYFST